MKKIISVISVLLFCLTMSAQSQADKLYKDGKESAKIQTIPSQENAIRLFQSALDRYETPADKQKCKKAKDETQKNKEKLIRIAETNYRDGEFSAKTKTIESQKKAIVKFQKAKSYYGKENNSFVTNCNNEISKANKTIEELQQKKQKSETKPVMDNPDELFKQGEVFERQGSKKEAIKKYREAKKKYKDEANKKKCDEAINRLSQKPEQVSPPSIQRSGLICKDIHNAPQKSFYMKPKVCGAYVKKFRSEIRGENLDKMEENDDNYHEIRVFHPDNDTLITKFSRLGRSSDGTDFVKVKPIVGKPNTFIVYCCQGALRDRSQAVYFKSSNIEDSIVFRQKGRDARIYADESSVELDARGKSKKKVKVYSNSTETFEDNYYLNWTVKEKPTWVRFKPVKQKRKLKIAQKIEQFFMVAGEIKTDPTMKESCIEIHVEPLAVQSAQYKRDGREGKIVLANGNATFSITIRQNPRY